MNNFWRHFFKGMSYFTLFPEPLHTQSRFAKYKSMTPKEAAQADAEAIRGDWEAVGGYMRAAMEKLEAGLSEEEKQALQEARDNRSEK